MRIAGVRRLRPGAYAGLVGVSGGILVGFALLGLTGQAAAIVGGVLLGLPLASYLYLTLGLAELGRRLRVYRVVAGSPVEGYAVPIRVVVESRSPLVSGFAGIIDQPPGDVPLLTEPVASGFLAPMGRIELLYFAAPRIGQRRFGNLVLRFRDPLGFYEAIVEVEPEGDQALLGLPSRQLLEREMRLLELEDPYTVARARLIKREGTEIYSIREFVEGDEPRLIDWKATARLGKLFVKELRRETHVPVLMVVAPGPRSLEGEPYRTPFERLARLLAAIAQDVIMRDGSVGLLIMTGQPIVEPPVKAAEGLGRIVRLLGSMPLPREGPRRALERVIDYLRRHSPGRTVILVATDSGTLPQLWREMSVLAEKKYTILYLVVERGAAPRLLGHSQAAALAGEGEAR